MSEEDIVNLRVIREVRDSDCPYVELNLPDSNDGSINFDLSTEFDIFPLDSCDRIKLEVNNNEDHQKRVEPIDQKSSSLPPAHIPQVDDCFELTVSYAVSPGNFVVIPHSETGDDACSFYTHVVFFGNTM